MKYKKGQGIMGVPFSMIFSIILIVFILGAGFVAVRFFLDFKKDSETHMFFEDFQTAIDNAWNAQSSDYIFKSILPSKVQYVCFVNFTAEDIGADENEKEIYNSAKFQGILWQTNTIMWPPESVPDSWYKTIKHMKLPTTNPYCIPAKESSIEIRIIKKFGEALPEIR